MSNKTQLQTNNTNLDALIARVNAAKDTAASLPDAGSGGSGGGSLEMCTGTIVVDAPNMEDFTIYALDNTLQVQTYTLDSMMGGSFTVAKGTIFTIAPWTSMYVISGDCTCYNASYAYGAYVANGDFTLKFA